MPGDIHALVWNTDNINCVIRHDVKDEMASLGEAKITRLYVIPRFATTGMVSQPVQASQDRTGVGVGLLQVPFGQSIEPDFLHVFEGEFTNEIALLHSWCFLRSFSRNSRLLKFSTTGLSSPAFSRVLNKSSLASSCSSFR